MPSRETLPVLKEQRVLLELLVLEKRSNETKLEQALSETITEPDPPAPAYRAEIATDAQEQHAIDEEIHLSFLGSEVRRELSGHCLLVDRILREIEEPQYNLSARLRGKVQEGALDLHWAEWSHLLRMHGREQVIKAFSRHHAVVSYDPSPCGSCSHRSPQLLTHHVKHSYWTHRYGESTLSRLDPRLNEDTSSRPSQFNPRLVAKAGERARFGHEMTSSRHEDFPVTSIPRLTSDTFAGGIPIPVYPPQEMPTSKWEPQWSLQSDQQAGQHGQYALQDYQLQLLLLEQQNKKKLMMARQERDSAARTDGKHRNAANAEAVERYPVGLPRRTSLNAGSPSWTGTNNAMLSNQSGRKPDDEIREVNDDNTNRSSIRSASPVSPAYSPQGTPPKSGSFEFEGPGAPGTSNARQSRPSSRFEGECNMMEPRPASASNLSFDEQDQNFNLDFSTLDDNDVLENFDFDSFLNTTNDDTFNFDAVVSIGDFEGPFSSTDGLGAKNRVTDEIHTLLADFGGFGEEDLLKLLSETTTDEPVLATN